MAKKRKKAKRACRYNDGKHSEKKKVEKETSRKKKAPCTYITSLTYVESPNGIDALRGKKKKRWERHHLAWYEKSRPKGELSKVVVALLYCDDTQSRTATTQKGGKKKKELKKIPKLHK